MTYSAFEPPGIFCFTALMMSVAAVGSSSRARQMADAFDSKARGSFTIIGTRSWKSRVMVAASGWFDPGDSCRVVVAACSAPD